MAPYMELCLFINGILKKVRSSYPNLKNVIENLSIINKLSKTIENAYLDNTINNTLSSKKSLKSRLKMKPR